MSSGIGHKFLQPLGDYELGTLVHFTGTWPPVRDVIKSQNGSLSLAQLSMRLTDSSGPLLRCVPRILILTAAHVDLSLGCELEKN